MLASARHQGPWMYLLKSQKTLTTRDDRIPWLTYMGSSSGKPVTCKGNLKNCILRGPKVPRVISD